VAQKPRAKPYILQPNSEWRPKKMIPMFVERPLELGEVDKIFDEIKQRAEYRDLVIFSRFAEYSPEELDKAEEPYEIVVDPLAFYVPYHYDPHNWGICFRIHRILDRLKHMLEIYTSMIPRYETTLDNKLLINVFAILWNVFMAYLYWHELTHHIVEDICSIRGDRYPLLNRYEEEGLAEWHAFSTIETGRARLPIIPKSKLIKIMKLREPPEELLLKPSLPFNLRPRSEMLSKVLDIIYYTLGRDKAFVYKPIVRPSVVQKLGLYWTPIREASVQGGYVYLVNGEEVYPRIYLTRC